MDFRKQWLSVLIALSLLVSLIPTALIISLGELKPFNIFAIIFIYTVILFIIGLELAEKRKLDTKNEVVALLEKEKMINGTLVSINNEEKLKNVIALEIERLQTLDQNASAIFFDVDDLGKINTVFGYDVGDQLLIELIRITQANIGLEDQIARIKGDTFAIILPDKTRQEAYNLSEKLHRILNSMLFGEVGKISCRFAVLGIFKTSNEDQIVKLAYEKLAQSKALGKGSIV